jgi:hypothetical protein
MHIICIIYRVFATQKYPNSVLCNPQIIFGIDLDILFVCALMCFVYVIMKVHQK